MKQSIVIDPNILGGKPVIAGTRIPIYMVLELLASGANEDQIIKNYYPQLTKPDIREAIRYAAKTVAGEAIYFSKLKRDEIHAAILE